MRSFKPPVLITLWDRPEYVAELIEIISTIKPEKLYVFSDIVNDVTSKQYAKILETRQLLKSAINWDVEVSYRYNTRNEGPSWGIHNAISWAFETTDRLIVLEHDYIPSKSFFPYCTELLEKYLNDERIWIISGLNHFQGKYNLNPEDSYFFSQYASIAGFATWKRCWAEVDNNLGKWPLFLNSNFRFDFMDERKWKVAKNKYNHFFKERVEANRLNTWDMQFVFTMWSNRGTGIVPSKNQIKMIGLDGFNSSGGASPFHFFNAHEDFEIVKHPYFVQNNHVYDKMYYKSGYFYGNVSVIKRVIKRVKKLIKKLSNEGIMVF
jgi:hypothetical protein